MAAWIAAMRATPQHVTLAGAAFDDPRERCRLHADAAARHGDALRLRLVADVHHVRLSARVEMGEVCGHGRGSNSPVGSSNGGADGLGI